MEIPIAYSLQKQLYTYTKNKNEMDENIITFLTIEVIENNMISIQSSHSLPGEILTGIERSFEKFVKKNELSFDYKFYTHLKSKKSEDNVIIYSLPGYKQDLF